MLLYESHPIRQRPLHHHHASHLLHHRPKRRAAQPFEQIFLNPIKYFSKPDPFTFTFDCSGWSGGSRAWKTSAVGHYTSTSSRFCSGWGQINLSNIYSTACARHNCNHIQVRRTPKSNRCGGWINDGTSVNVENVARVSIWGQQITFALELSNRSDTLSRHDQPITKWIERVSNRVAKRDGRHRRGRGRRKR